MKFVVFGAPGAMAARVVVQSIVAALKQRPTLEFAAFIATTPHPARAKWKQFALSAIRRMLNPRLKHSTARHLPSIPQMLRRSQTKILTAPSGDPNSPSIVAELRDNIRPDFALVVACAPIFRRDLLNACRNPINYHDALLPRYRGLRAVSWAIYFKDLVCGYTWHRMTENIDDGNIMLQEYLDLDPRLSAPELVFRVVRRTAGRTGELLDRILEGHPGAPQTGEASYYGRKALREIRTITNPADHTSDELFHRVHAFNWIYLPLGGRLCEVTQLTSVSRGGDWLTSDGVHLKAARCFFLPPFLYRLIRPFRRKLAE